MSATSTITAGMGFCLREDQNLFQVSNGIDCGLALSNALHLMAVAQELCTQAADSNGKGADAASILLDAAMALVDSVNLSQKEGGAA
jgi:hypothetical protein